MCPWLAAADGGRRGGRAGFVTSAALIAGVGGVSAHAVVGG